ncbi:MAG: hypothetical protein EOP47_07725 [Sphingobacteriaceae bacterium]|nr:MAG: hypothetical protein EOP47_07725 [Sphingobacteriaceae bacterium]
MKTIKLSIIALIVACSFQIANAQVRVGVGINIGTPVYYRPAPVVYAPAPVVYSAPRTVVYTRPVVYRRHYAPVRYKVKHVKPRHYRHW